MVKLSRTKLAIAVGGLALSAPFSVGVASAQPDFSPLINTTCSYDQFMAALDAQQPGLAQQLTAQASAESALRTFLAGSKSSREQTIAQLQGQPNATRFLGSFSKIAASCSDY